MTTHHHNRDHLRDHLGTWHRTTTDRRPTTGPNADPRGATPAWTDELGEHIDITLIGPRDGGPTHRTGVRYRHEIQPDGEHTATDTPIGVAVESDSILEIADEIGRAHV